MPKDEQYILEFYGTECPWCMKMIPVIEKLENEEGVKITKYEIWHNKENVKKMMEYEEILTKVCGGSIAVPSFVNLKTNEALCGYQDYESFRSWALK